MYSLQTNVKKTINIRKIKHIYSCLWGLTAHYIVGTVRPIALNKSKFRNNRVYLLDEDKNQVSILDKLS